MHKFSFGGKSCQTPPSPPYRSALPGGFKKIKIAHKLNKIETSSYQKWIPLVFLPNR